MITQMKAAFHAGCNSPVVGYNTIQYKICKAPYCRGFRGAGEQDS